MTTEEPMIQKKNEITIGNVLSVATTLISAGGILAAVALSWGKTTTIQDQHDKAIKDLTIEMRAQAAEFRVKTDALSSKQNDLQNQMSGRIATIESDVKLVLKLLDRQEKQDKPSRASDGR